MPKLRSALFAFAALVVSIGINVILYPVRWDPKVVCEETAGTSEIVPLEETGYGASPGGTVGEGSPGYYYDSYDPYGDSDSSGSARYDAYDSSDSDSYGDGYSYDASSQYGTDDTTDTYDPYDYDDQRSDGTSGYGSTSDDEPPGSSYPQGRSWGSESEDDATAYGGSSSGSSTSRNGRRASSYSTSEYSRSTGADETSSSYDSYEDSYDDGYDPYDTSGREHREGAAPTMDSSYDDAPRGSSSPMGPSSKSWSTYEDSADDYDPMDYLGGGTESRSDRGRRRAEDRSVSTYESDDDGSYEGGDQEPGIRDRSYADASSDARTYSYAADEYSARGASLGSDIGQGASDERREPAWRSTRPGGGTSDRDEFDVADHYPASGSPSVSEYESRYGRYYGEEISSATDGDDVPNRGDAENAVTEPSSEDQPTGYPLPPWEVERARRATTETSSTRAATGNIFTYADGWNIKANARPSECLPLTSPVTARYGAAYAELSRGNGPLSERAAKTVAQELSSVRIPLSSGETASNGVTATALSPATRLADGCDTSIDVRQTIVASDDASGSASGGAVRPRLDTGYYNTTRHSLVPLDRAAWPVGQSEDLASSDTASVRPLPSVDDTAEDATLAPLESVMAVPVSSRYASERAGTDESLSSTSSTPIYPEVD